MNKLETIVLSGLSGSGKSSALSTLEDLGYFCVDNLPIPLFMQFIDFLQNTPALDEIQKLAVVMDAREKVFLSEFTKSMAKVARQTDLKIIFLDAKDDTIVRRFSETRRRHPLSPETSPIIGIKRERLLLKPILARADKTIDTTELTTRELRSILLRYLTKESKKRQLTINTISFGYKFGLPPQADLVIDVRFIPNPFFVHKLRKLNGRNRKVQQFVYKKRETKQFLKLFTKFLNFLIRQYEAEGKSYLNIGIGCTGGQHRSVAIAEKISSDLKKCHYNVNIEHREL